MQDCSNSSALAMELLQSCTKSSISISLALSPFGQGLVAIISISSFVHLFSLLPCLWVYQSTWLNFQGIIWYLHTGFCNLYLHSPEGLNELAPGRCSSKFKYMIFGAFDVKVTSHECLRLPLMISQHWIRPWPWPWPWIFMVKYLICCISGKNSPIAMERKNKHIDWSPGLKYGH